MDTINAPTAEVLIQQPTAQIEEGKFRFLRVEQLATVSSHCENCGHAIAQCYFIEHIDTAQQMRVGCECVVLLLLPGQKISFDLARRRLNRAEAQWTRQVPAPRAGETRDQYINRRIREAGNALDAHKEWTATLANDTLESMAEQALKKQRYQNPLHYCFGKPPSEETRQQRKGLIAAWDALLDIECKAVIRRFEEKWCASHFDFSRPTWEVKNL